MSTSHLVGSDRGANAADCARLWNTLTTEFIPGLLFVIKPVTKDKETGYIEIAVVDQSVHQIDGEALENVWAVKEFHNQLHLISVGQLFDLLITAYRTIDRYFELGEAAAPLRRVR